MTTAAEKLSRLVSDKMAYSLPDTKPAVGQVITVTAAGIDQVNLGFSNVALPDPIDRFDLDPVTNILTLHTVGGATYDIDLSPVLTDTNTFITAVADTAVGEIGITLNDGSSVTYTATLNDPELKADKTTQVRSGSTQLHVANPTLADDVTLTLDVGLNNGDLVALSAANTLPPAIIQNLVQTQSFLSLPSAPYNAGTGVTPTGTDGDMLMIKGTGTLNVVPFGGTASVPHRMVAGDIIRMIAGEWHIISRSQTDSLAASKVTTVAVGTPTLGGNVQDVIAALELRKVPTTRNLISSDINQLAINGLVQDDIDADVTFDIVTNTPNGIAALNSLGVLDPSLLPATSFEFHGIQDATAALTATRPDGVTAWTSGDQLEINVASAPADAAFQFVPTGQSALASAPLNLGDLLTFDGTRWVQSAQGGAISSGSIATAGGTGANTHVVGADLNSVMQAIDNNAVWITTNQNVAGDKTLTGHTTAAQLSIGGTGTEYDLPTARTATAGETLIARAGGAVTWGDVAGNRVSFAPAAVDGVAATNVQGAIADLSTSCLKLSPNANQMLEGDATGFHTILQSNTGIIMGDGRTANQITNVIFDEGRI